MGDEIVRDLDLINKLVHTGTDEIVRALELLEKNAHTPNIDAKELTLMLAYHMKLNLLLTTERAVGEMITGEALSMHKAESLHEESKENIQKWRENIEGYKARLRKIIEEDKEKVGKILKDAGLGK